MRGLIVRTTKVDFMMNEVYPMLMQPALKVKVWGGRKLETMLGKTLPDDAPYGESWEIHDSAVIANGALRGQTLGDAAKAHPAALLGKKHDPTAGIPLLAKFLDANDWLSVQVHPNDAQAAQLEGEPRGKTEAWYVLHAEPGAKLVIGVHSGTSSAEMARAIRDNGLEKLLVYQEVTAGDVLFMHANTIHALGPGILIYEIQQSSDVTYRLYDWGRVDLDGKPRELHIDKGVLVANIESLPSIRRTGMHADAEEVEIATSPFFNTVLHRLRGADRAVEMGGTCHLLSCIDGAVEVRAESGESITLDKGRSAFMPAGLGRFTLSGTGDVLRAW